MKKQEVIDHLLTYIPDNELIDNAIHFTINNTRLITSCNLHVISNGTFYSIEYDAILALFIEYNYITIVTETSRFNCITN